MKVEQFIREFGVKRAKQLINNPLHPKMTHVSDDGRHWVNEHNKNLDENIRKQLPNLMRLEDLKRLVELLDFVQTYGGIVMAKRQLDLFLRVNLEQGTMLSNTVSKLKDAVAIHESIYGGSESHAN